MFSCTAKQEKAAERSYPSLMRTLDFTFVTSSNACSPSYTFQSRILNQGTLSCLLFPHPSLLSNSQPPVNSSCHNNQPNSLNPKEVQLTLGIAPLAAKTPVAKLMTLQPNRSDKKPANTGPKRVAAAMEQLKRAKAWAYAPPGPKMPGFSFSFSSTTTERSAASGETMRMRVQP